jgi:predicted Zn finger-like uncharacterized protein
MILTCPSCGTRYRADPVSFSAPGRNVRCAKCGHVWFQPSPEPEAFAVPELPAPTAGAERQQDTTQRGVGGERKLPGRAAGTGKLRDWAERIRNTDPQTLGFIVLLIVLAAIGWTAERYRQSIVRLWPESSRFYSAVGLPVTLGNITIRDIDLRKQNQDGTQVLSVTGRIVNISDHDQPIPRLLVVLLDNSNRELYRWTFDPGFNSLAPGAEHDFGTTLPNPPPDARTANVNFAAEDFP